MSDGEINYARSHDGLHLAYQVHGEGPIDILEVGGFGTLFPLDAAREQPRWNRFEERLHSFARLIKFDLRGIGYSDRFATQPTVADYVSDAIAVLDAVGVEHVAVLASGVGGFAALELAAQHPDRVSSLLLANASAGFSQDAAYLSNPELLDLAIERRAAVEPDSGRTDDGGSDIDFLAPSLAGDPDVRRWWSRTAARGAGPAVAEAVWELALRADVRGSVPQISGRTMVIVTKDNNFVDPAFGRWLAEHIDSAVLCEIDAPDHIIWAVPGNAVANEIERFLTGSVAAGGARSIAAVLFTDIVDSTSHNTERGDRAWLEVMARHDDLAEEEITLRGGRVVKRLGDGLMAAFPLASDALDAAAAVISATADLGVAVRTGVHVAEIEEVGDDILGLGVTIAARAMSIAAGGEVLTTRAVADMLAGSAHTLETLGNHQLKGVAGMWELLALVRT